MLKPEKLSKEEEQEFLSSQNVEQKNCPSPYEDHFCVLRTNNRSSHISLVGRLEISVNNETSKSNSISIISEVVFRDEKENTSYEFFSILGVGFPNGNFRSNAFFDGVLKQIEAVDKKKAPEVFGIDFNGNKFSAFVGK